MNKYIIPLFALSVSAQAAVSITSSAVINIEASSGVVAPTNTKAILVVSNTGASFSNLLDGDSLTEGSTIGASGDTIIAVGQAQDVGGGVTGISITKSNFNLTAAVATGNFYAVYWFPTLTSVDTTVVAGTKYGLERESNWVIASDGGSTDGAFANSGPYLPDFTVQPVPEPSSVALVGLGSLALLARRRKK